MEHKNKIKNIAFLVSCASILQIAESLIPHPIPGIRLGLANIITLVALVRLGFLASLEIAVLRTVVSSFVLGTFLSPAFALSFIGAFVSTLVMGSVYTLIRLTQKRSFSLIGISLWGAVANNSAQIFLVYLILIRHTGVLMFLPWLGISAVITGWITGLVAVEVCRRLEQSSETVLLEVPEAVVVPSFISTRYMHLNSPVHRLAPEIKICTVLLLIVYILFLKSFNGYIIVLSSIAGVVVLSRIPFSIILLRLRNLSLFIGSAFFIPIFFHTTGEVLFRAGPLHVTYDGFIMGAMFGFRLILIVISASTLMLTTSLEKLTSGLKKLLFPVKIFGISNVRIAEIVAISLTSLPELWRKICFNIKNLKPEEKRLKKIIPALSGIIVALYRQIDV